MASWVLWDGDCGFCGRWASWVQARDLHHHFQVVAYQKAPSPPMTPELREHCRRAVQVITADGRRLAAGRAVLHVLRGVSRPRWMWGVLAVPPFVWVVEAVYRVVAANRMLFSRLFYPKNPPTCDT